MKVARAMIVPLTPTLSLGERENKDAATFTLSHMPAIWAYWLETQQDEL
jgi:hypothetical protein